MVACVTSSRTFHRNAYDKKRILHRGLSIDLLGFPVNLTPSSNFFYIDGACIFLSKQNFQLLGEFDEGMFIIHEDIDLSWKAHLLNFQFLILDDQPIYHKSGHILGKIDESNKFKTNIFRRFHGEKNILRNLIKNYSFLVLIPILFIYFLLRLVEFFILLFTCNFNLAPIYPKAIIWNLLSIKTTLFKRKLIQSNRKVSDIIIIKKMYKFSARVRLLLKSGFPRIS